MAIRGSSSADVTLPGAEISRTMRLEPWCMLGRSVSITARVARVAGPSPSSPRLARYGRNASAAVTRPSTPPSRIFSNCPRTASSGASRRRMCQSCYNDMTQSYCPSSATTNDVRSERAARSLEKAGARRAADRQAHQDICTRAVHELLSTWRIRVVTHIKSVPL